MSNLFFSEYHIINGISGIVYVQNVQKINTMGKRNTGEIEGSVICETMARPKQDLRSHKILFYYLKCLFFSLTRHSRLHFQPENRLTGPENKLMVTILLYLLFLKESHFYNKCLIKCHLELVETRGQR